VGRVHREAKAYLDAVRGVSRGQELIASAMTDFFEQGSVSYRQARLYKDINEFLSNQGRREFDDVYRATVMEPVTNFGIMFPKCEELTKKRAKKLLDYDAARAHVQRSIDRPSGDAEKVIRVPWCNKHSLRYSWSLRRKKRRRRTIQSTT